MANASQGGGIVAAQQVATDADKWNALTAQFKELAAEERVAGGRPLEASAPHWSDSREVTEWHTNYAVSDRLREDFCLYSEEAARVFAAVPDQANLFHLWLHRL